jgi:hypothetical protein
VVPGARIAPRVRIALAFHWRPKLGEGGQSVAYLARTPEKVALRQKSEIVLSAMSTQLNDSENMEAFANAVADLSRADH